MSFNQLNKFDNIPVKMNMNRSKFDLSHDNKTTFNAGKLIPVMCEPVLPDDTWKISVASVLRSITPAVPVMDNGFLDLFCFWVPNRIATVHPKDWEKVCGENVSGYWAPSSESTLENTGNTWHNASSVVVGVQSLAQYLTLPIGYYNQNIELSRLPFNGYWEIYNNWFRDQNTQAPIDWKSYTNSVFVQAVCLSNGSGLVNVNKMHDYFTSCLPSPAKTTQSVLLPLGTSAPVITKTDDIYSGVAALANVPNLRFIGSTSIGSNSKAPLTVGNSLSTSSYISEPGVGSQTTGAGTSKLVPNNLYADLTNATAATINDLRQAFAIQRLFEKDARGGTRYREMLKTHFGVSIPDNTVQIPEYLGGKRIPLNMLQVLQTAPDSTSPVGTTGAFSNTCDNSYLCTKSFAEFGYIYVVACVRNCQSYSQGIRCDFLKNRRFDFYDPTFANLGEKAVKTLELYANGSSDPTEVFGYQEAWAEYRYIPNKITGYLADGSNLADSQVWTYQNHFTAKPVLNSSFMVQDRSQIDNTLAVQNASYQFFGDFHFDLKVWRAMPYYSIPGLIDHH